MINQPIEVKELQHGKHPLLELRFNTTADRAAWLAFATKQVVELQRNPGRPALLSSDRALLSNGLRQAYGDQPGGQLAHDVLKLLDELDRWRHGLQNDAISDGDINRIIEAKDAAMAFVNTVCSGRQAQLNGATLLYSVIRFNGEAIEVLLRDEGYNECCEFVTRLGMRAIIEALRAS